VKNKFYYKKIVQLRKNIIFLYQDRIRIEKLKCFEQICLSDGYNFIAGIDEAGRGSLAGPVVAAAVIIGDIKKYFLAELKDSKKLSKEKRNYLFEIIKEKCFDYGIGIVSPKIIDKINIAQATFLAMKRSIVNLRNYPESPDFLLVDGFKIPFIKVPQKNLIKGEDKSISIAAASIIAKVTRDKIMYAKHEMYPCYNFNRNVGYGTAEHLKAIKKYGISPLHRKTFKKVKENICKQKFPKSQLSFDGYLK